MTDTTGSNTVAVLGPLDGKELIRECREYGKTAVHIKLQELTAKLHHGRQTETDDAADRAPAPAGSTS